MGLPVRLHMELEIVIKSLSICLWCNCQVFHMFSDGIKAATDACRCSIVCCCQACMPVLAIN